jgi:hypothetical protein
MHEPLIIFVLGGSLAAVASSIRRWRAASARGNS